MAKQSGRAHVRTGSIVRAAALTTASLLISACSTVKDAYMVDSVTKEENDVTLDQSGLFLNGQYVPVAINIYDPNSKFPGTQQSIYAFAGLDAASRNRAMDYLVQRSNRICEAHEAGIIADASSSNFGLSETATILSGMGALFTPAATVRALSGSAAIVNATRDNFNNVFYQNILASAVVKSIDKTRTEKMSALEASRTKSINDYSADQMVRAVLEYHSACSFYSGLVTLTDAAARINPSSVELTERITALKDKLTELNATISGLNDQIDRIGNDATKSAQKQALEAQRAGLLSAQRSLSDGIAQASSQLALTSAASK
ncbi:MAG: hypothetical protein HY243_03360 [Proteobacteria bacterium]|nr:hypothetical protein [Pseudomonadota bacterium]